VNTMLEPYLPDASAKLRAALGAPGGTVSPLEPLFPKRGVAWSTAIRISTCASRPTPSSSRRPWTRASTGS